MIRLTYAPDVDVLAIWFAPGAKTIGAREIAPDTYADFNQDGRLLGIEVLNASGLYDPAELVQLPTPGQVLPGGTESHYTPRQPLPKDEPTPNWVGNPVTPHPYGRGDEVSK